MPTTRSFIQRFDDVSIPLTALLRIFLGAYFIKAGILKALDPVTFLKGVRLYEMLPEEPAVFLNMTAVVLPWLEIICGVALVLGVLRRGAGVLIAAMLCMFSPAILLRALAVMREESVSFFAVEFDCGCGTGADVIWIKLAQNLGLFALALTVVVSRSTRFSLGSLFGRARGDAVVRCTRCGRAVKNTGEPICDECRRQAPVGVSAPDPAI